MPRRETLVESTVDWMVNLRAQRLQQELQHVQEAIMDQQRARIIVPPQLYNTFATFINGTMCSTQNIPNKTIDPDVKVDLNELF